MTPHKRSAFADYMNDVPLEPCSATTITPKAGKLLEVWPGGGALLVLRQRRGKRQKEQAAQPWECPSA